MSRARKPGAPGGVDVAEAAGNSAGPPAPPVDVAGDQARGGPDPWAEVRRLRGELNAAQIAANDANRLLFQVKEQRNALMDDVMLLRAQLKVAVEDGAAGWAAANGQPH